MDTKICNKCQRELPVSQFHKRNNRPNGYMYQCKECRSVHRKKQSKEHKSQYYLRYKDRQKELQNLNKDKQI
jgi:Zn-finger protein